VLLVAGVLAVSFQFFDQGGFKGSLHAQKRLAAQFSRQCVGQAGLKAGVPDAVNLLFGLGNRRHERPIGERRIRRSVYPVAAKTG
jgi:hypothetical protein